jgi:hypothetical protein
MKPAGLHLLVLAMAATLLAEDAPPPAPAKISTRLTEEIRATLPRFEPPPAPVLDQPRDVEPDPGVLRLPTFTVKEKRPRSHDPDVWLTNKAVQQKAMAAYKGSMTDLEWALNSWFIPLFSAPASVRARSAYESSKARAELLRLNDLVDRIGRQDPATSADLHQELINMVLQRPPGSK